jgi:hypothetical protein
MIRAPMTAVFMIFELTQEAEKAKIRGKEERGNDKTHWRTCRHS